MVWFFPQVPVICSPSSAGCFQPAISSLFFHDFGCLTFPPPLPSLSCLRRAHAVGVWSSFFFGKGKRRKGMLLAHTVKLLSSLQEGGKNKSKQLILGRGKGTRACSSFGEECPLLSPCCIYTPLKCKMGCLDVGPRLSLSPFWVILELVSIPILLQDRQVQH